MKLNCSVILIRMQIHNTFAAKCVREGKCKTANGGNYRIKGDRREGGVVKEGERRGEEI